MHTSCKKQSVYLPLAIYGEGGRGGEVRKRPLDVEIVDRLRVFDDKFASRLDFVAHEQSTRSIGFDGIGNLDLFDDSALGIHRRFPELVVVHFAQTFISLDFMRRSNVIHSGIEERFDRIEPLRRARWIAEIDEFIAQCLVHGFIGAVELLEPVVLYKLFRNLRALERTRLSRRKFCIERSIGSRADFGRDEDRIDVGVIEVSIELFETRGKGLGRAKVRLVEWNAFDDGIDDARIAVFGHARQILLEEQDIVEQIEQILVVELCARFGDDVSGRNRAVEDVFVECAFVFEVSAFVALFDFEKRRLGDVDVSAFDDLGHLTEEKREQKRANVGSVDVGIGHDDDLVIAQFFEFEIVADARTESAKDDVDRLRIDDFVESCLFDVQDLTA